MNIKRIIAYAGYYGVFWNIFIFLSIRLLDYFEGYNWKSVVTINIITMFFIIPIHIQIKKIIDNNTQ
jgi:hypothetical protein